MDDFTNYERLIVRELSCRLCLCTDVVKLKPLSNEVKRKIKKLFDITIRSDDNLPKAICHDCLQQVSNMHLYLVKVEKTQKFLDFHKTKSVEEKKSENGNAPVTTVANMSVMVPKSEKLRSPEEEIQQGDVKPEIHQGDVKSFSNVAIKSKKKSNSKFMEAMPIEELIDTEKVDKNLLKSNSGKKSVAKETFSLSDNEDFPNRSQELDRVVLIDGRPAHQGAALDKQITLFYKMECCICHEKGFHFRSLMKHYKDRHGVPGYVTCCNKKFHYFYPKKIIEHMAFHLQPNIFMCPSCHTNFASSQELHEHRIHGGRSDGKILCPRCPERFPTYRELGVHIITHRTGGKHCDYCGKQLKHHHRKKTVNHMEDVILCSHCIRSLKAIERQEREVKEKNKSKNHEPNIGGHGKHTAKQTANSFSLDEEEASTD